MKKLNSDLNDFYPDDFSQLQQFGDCYSSTGDFEKAGKYYDRAAQSDPDAPEPYLGLGAIAVEQSEWENARNAFNVALRLCPDSARAYTGLAIVAQNTSDYKTAFDMYLKALELDVDNLQALLGLFQTSCQMGSFFRVIYYLELYLNMHPDDTSVMFSLAALYMKDHRLKDAYNILDSLLKLEPVNHQARNLMEEIEHQIYSNQLAKNETL